jgi:hypothetical protein
VSRNAGTRARKRGQRCDAVSVPEGMADELGWAGVAEEELVRQSFAFLLEREPPTSILRSFSLDVIGRYFPEYPNEMRQRLRT